MSVPISFHANKRMRQRGLTEADVQALFHYASNTAHSGECEILTLGAEGERELRETGVSLQAIDRLKRTAVVMATDTSEVVTVLKLHGARQRRYRRQH